MPSEWCRRDALLAAASLLLTPPPPPLPQPSHSLLRAAFSVIGPVANVKIGRRGNFGFVSFENDGHVEDALRLHGTNIGGAEVTVEKTNPPAPRRARNAPTA
jgi:hypothetical protein